jgi:hypothetical protein
MPFSISLFQNLQHLKVENYRFAWDGKIENSTFNCTGCTGNDVPEKAIEFINVPATGATAQPPDISFRITPNPVSNWLNVVYSSEQDILFTLHDVNGRQIASMSLFHYFKNRLLDVSQFPAGVYLASVIQNGSRVWSEKLVIVR